MRLLLVAFALAAGCSQDDVRHQRPAPVLSPAAVAAPDAGARAALGVPACDAYLEELARCIHKMDKAAQPAARRFLEDTRRAWAQSARAVDGSGALSSACRLASDAARNATAGLGCSF
ncbi:MAG TPA: hypothetical protein VKE22_00335 [Haliangiales bacterium]|nr:hypothetical protein [Haliangiales bacterium]